MDINLPGISGNTAAKEIRKIERSKGLTPSVIVGLTGGITLLLFNIYSS